MSILKSIWGLVKKENKIKSLIIGAGSIGLRHVQILNDLGHETVLITKKRY